MSLVLLFCGIPGSGKSTLCQAVLNKLLTESPQNTPIIEILSFDRFEVEKELWSERSFKTGRQQALDQLSNTLSLANTPSSASSASLHSPTNHGQISRIILVDDIMYLRSMRKQVFQLCRRHAAPLVTVYVRTSLDIALERNRNRQAGAFVHEETLYKLFDEFEAPDARFVQDRHVVTIDNTSTNMKAAVEQVVIAARMALQNPVIYTPAPVTDAAADDDCAIDTTAARASCNPAEASDLLLRKTSSSIIKAHMSMQVSSHQPRPETCDNKRLGEALSKAKVACLAKFKVKRRNRDDLTAEEQVSLFQRELTRMLSAAACDTENTASVSEYVSTLFDSIKYQA